MVNTIIALLGALVMVKLLMVGGDQSMVILIGQGFASWTGVHWQNFRAKDLVKALHRDEYIDEEASLNEALRRLIDNRFLSLIATRGGSTTGILRVVDVFQYVCDRLRAELG